MKTIVTADRTADLTDELCEKYGVQLIPYHIVLGDEEYIDNVDITVKEIFDRYEVDGLPKTSAIAVAEYIDFFNEVREEVGEPCEIVHITLGSALTSSYQNCNLAAEELGGVYPVDSCTLSSACGLIVMDAADMAADGKSAAEIQAYLQTNVSKYHASFVLDTLEYLRAGGRCSSVAALASAALKIKPSIIVDTSQHGAMRVGRKYRGKLEKALVKYVHDELAQYDNIDYRDCMITCSTELEDLAEYDLVQEILEKETPFENIHRTQASCAIACHCGPGTLGILFRTL